MKYEGRVFEVALRDGLQSEKKILSLEEKAGLCTRLLDAEPEYLEVGSFVRADKIPQLENTEELVELARAHIKNNKLKTKLFAFAANAKGVQRAIDTKALDGVSLFVAASDTFCKKNVGRSQRELMSALPELLELASNEGLERRVYLSNLVYCPYEGEVPVSTIASCVDQLVDIGFEKIALSDTTGHATPRHVREILSVLCQRYSPENFAMHLHDTRNLALAGVWEAQQFGVSEFDSSSAGLGGCPYAPGAAGNLATEDLVYFLDHVAKADKRNLAAYIKAGCYVEEVLGRPLSSKVLRTLECDDASRRAS